MLISEAFGQYIFQEIKLQGGASKTMQNYTTAQRSFTECNGDLPIQLITLDSIARWRMTLDDRSKQMSTVKSYTSCLRNVLGYYKRRGYDVIDWRDIELPKVVRKEAVWLEIDELKAILGAAKNIRDKAIIATLFSCGGRVSEVLSLNRDSIRDGKAQVLGKGSRLNTLRFDKQSLDIIDEYLETRRDKLPPLFISGQYRRITVQRVEQILHVMTGEAGIEKNVTPHTLRHTFASDLRRNGADLLTVMKQLNHSSITTTQIYTHIGKEQADESHAQYHTVIE